MAKKISDNARRELVQAIAERYRANGRSENLFSRLRAKYPGKFREGQIRTLQRRVHGWRRVMAKQPIGISHPQSYTSAAIQVTFLGEATRREL